VRFRETCLAVVVVVARVRNEVLYIFFATPSTPLRSCQTLVLANVRHATRPLSYGPPWAHYLGGYQDRLLGGPLGLPDLRCTAPDGVKHKDYGGEVLG
jgi:hypothetical protein